MAKVATLENWQKKQAVVTAVDCNKFFIDYCIDCAKSDGLNIKHLVCNSNNLCDIDDESFDIVLCINDAHGL